MSMKNLNLKIPNSNEGSCWDLEFFIAIAIVIYFFIEFLTDVKLTFFIFGLKFVRTVKQT